MYHSGFGLVGGTGGGVWLIPRLQSIPYTYCYSLKAVVALFVAKGVGGEGEK